MAMAFHTFFQAINETSVNSRKGGGEEIKRRSDKDPLHVSAVPETDAACAVPNVR